MYCQCVSLIMNPLPSPSSKLHSRAHMNTQASILLMNCSDTSVARAEIAVSHVWTQNRPSVCISDTDTGHNRHKLNLFSDLLQSLLVSHPGLTEGGAPGEWETEQCFPRLIVPPVKCTLIVSRTSAMRQSPLCSSVHQQTTKVPHRLQNHNIIG